MATLSLNIPIAPEYQPEIGDVIMTPRGEAEVIDFDLTPGFGLTDLMRVRYLQDDAAKQGPPEHRKHCPVVRRKLKEGIQL